MIGVNGCSLLIIILISCVPDRREHARNRQQLESLIAEIDKVAGDVDTSLTKRQQQVELLKIVTMTLLKCASVVGGWLTSCL